MRADTRDERIKSLGENGAAIARRSPSESSSKRMRSVSTFEIVPEYAIAIVIR
jgi:hypothetical protein